MKMNGSLSDIDERNLTICEYNEKHHVVIENEEHIYRVYISSIGYPNGFEYKATGVMDLSNQWLQRKSCTNKNVGKIVLIK